MLNILINGICGRMGRAVYEACMASDGAFSPIAGVDMAGEPAGLICPVYRSIDDVAEKADVIIDFSIPAALPHVLRYAEKRGIPVVIGTTALTERDHKLISTAAERIPVFQTGNMSLGVNLQMALTKEAYAALGRDFDVEIIEKHHRRKIDAPSGTALMLADCVSGQSTEELEYVFGRHEKNKRRSNAEIGIHSIRGGTIVGEHSVMFIGDDEVVELRHAAYSKQVFVRGALRAAKFLAGKQSGRYNMQDVVSEHDVASHLTTLEDQAVVNVSIPSGGLAASQRIFETLSQRSVFVDMISLTFADDGCSIGFSLRQTQLSAALDALETLRAEMPDLRFCGIGDVVKLTVEGSGMALHHGVAAQLLKVLVTEGIHVQLITTSETKIEFCVDTIDTVKAVAEVENGFLNG